PGGAGREPGGGVRQVAGVARKPAVRLRPDREPVHREPRHRLAVAGAPLAAGGTLTARDLEGDADQVAGLDRLHRVADLGHLCDALVAEREGPGDRRQALYERDVDVAGGERHRLDDRLAVALEGRVGRVAPLELAPLDELERSHAGTP